MSDQKSIFGNMTAADILDRINNIINQTGYISAACESLATLSDDSCEAKANALEAVVRCRETTNQQILRLYEKMYDDMIRLSETDQQPKEATEAHHS